MWQLKLLWKIDLGTERPFLSFSQSQTQVPISEAIVWTSRSSIGCWPANSTEFARIHDREVAVTWTSPLRAAADASASQGPSKSGRLKEGCHRLLGWVFPGGVSHFAGSKSDYRLIAYCMPGGELLDERRVFVMQPVQLCVELPAGSSCGSVRCPFSLCLWMSSSQHTTLSGCSGLRAEIIGESLLGCDAEHLQVAYGDCLAHHPKASRDVAAPKKKPKAKAGNQQDLRVTVCLNASPRTSSYASLRASLLASAR
eukprot:5121234-Amphidinium_carterae.2